MNLRAVKLPSVKAIEQMRVLYAELRACSPHSFYETRVKNLRGSLYCATDYAVELERLGYHKDSHQYNVFAELLCAIINAIAAPHSENTRSTLKKAFNTYQEIAGHFYKNDKIAGGFMHEVMCIETGLNYLCRVSKTNAEYNFFLGKPLVTVAEAAALLKVKQMPRSGSAVTSVVEEKKDKDKKEADKSSSPFRPI